MARRFGLSQVQTALYNAITGLGYSCYDEVPKDTKFPYVTLGEAYSNESDLEDKTNNARSVNAQINVWSREAGFKDIQTMAEAILGTIATLSITNFQIIDYDYNLDLLRDPDGISRRGLIEITFNLAQTS